MIKQARAGEGAFGIVYLAQDREKHSYAIKRNLIYRDTSFIGSLRELDLLTRVRGHPFLVNLISVSHGSPFSGPLSPVANPSYKDDDVHFVFERASHDVFHHIFCTEGKPDWNQVKMFMAQVLLGLEYLHSKQIIHRDLKPANLLYFEGEGVVKICDFGLSKFRTRQGAQTPRMFTSWYRAPEVTTNWTLYDYKADIWSLGCIFFELTTRVPFVEGVADDNAEILQYILDNYPETPTNDQLARLLALNPNPPRVTIKNKKRSGWPDQPSLGGDFVSLLKGMLALLPSERLGASECLAHPFFKDICYRELIKKTRADFPLTSPASPLLQVISGPNRSEAMAVASLLFEQRSYYSWYSHRILFQAIDLYDRYLVWYSQNGGSIRPQLYFLVCLYVSIKYFSTMTVPIAFPQLLPPEYKSVQMLQEAEAFEKLLVRDVLEYNIYRETVYEAGDYYDHVLTEEEVGRLLLVYTCITSYSGLSAKRLFKLFQSAIHPKSESLLR